MVMFLASIPGLTDDMLVDAMTRCLLEVRRVALPDILARIGRAPERDPLSTRVQ